MEKKKYFFDEDEFFEDASWSPSRDHQHSGICERCIQCGFPVIPDEDALELIANGDVIHRACLEEYIDENLSLFAKAIKG